MSDSTISATELTSQYINQVTADLERNAKEQERISGEIAALQEQLLALQHDRTVLVNVHKALGAGEPGEPVAKPAPEETASASVPQQKTAAPHDGKPARAKKSATTSGTSGSKKAKKPTANKPAAKAAAPKAAEPTLVELIRGYLTEQTEPLSAAEITTALSQAHPDRRIQANVVRTTAEGLVAKGHVHRTKQGSSVFYTAASAEGGRQAGEAAAEPEPQETAVSG